jgi:hypothetical protein
MTHDNNKSDILYFLEYESEYEYHKVLGVFSSEAAAETARELYMSDTRNGYDDETESIENYTIVPLTLDSLHWREVWKRENEKARRKAEQKAAEEEARRNAEEEARQARLDALKAKCDEKDILLVPNCTEQDRELALQLAEDAGICAQWDSDPFWHDKKSAVTRSVKWATERLRGKFQNAGLLIQAFDDALGLDCTALMKP